MAPMVGFQYLFNSDLKCPLGSLLQFESDHVPSPRLQILHDLPGAVLSQTSHPQTPAKTLRYIYISFPKPRAVYTRPTLFVAMDERKALTSGVVPVMQFRPRDSPAPGPRDLNKDQTSDPALERFKVNGNAIVSGGGGDLGSTACRALLEHGLQGLVVFDLDPVQGNQRLDLLRTDFPAANIHFKKVDITKEDDVERAVEEASITLGPINHLLCFAATICCLPTADVSPKVWRRIQDVNTTGGFILAQSVGKKMIAAKDGGSIVLIGSIAGHRVCYPQPQAAYNVSKAGVIMLKNCLAAEWAVHGIRVNSISPGYMDTIMNEGEGLNEARDVWLSRNPLGRMGDREEVTGAIVLLSSRAGSYINGSDILVDGGHIVC